MSISGCLSEFSLPELFRFLEEGHKTGLLSLSSLSTTESEQQQHHYIWFRQGRIVAATNRLDSEGLINLIDQRGFIKITSLEKIAETCPVDSPLGLCLKSKSALDAEQLRMLFSVQVTRSVCALFALEDAWFQFDTNVSVPTSELTGLSSPATEVTLAGLRSLKDWTALKEKLPEPTSALISTSPGQPKISINQTEWQVWEFTKGTVTLKEIANQLRLPIEKVQQIAFRLIVVGLAEELPMLTFVENNVEPTNDTQERSTLSSSFLENLLGFLNNQA